MAKEFPCCPYCGSDDISIDATARWDTTTGDWILAGTFDNAFCMTCERETKSLDWKEEESK